MRVAIVYNPNSGRGRAARIAGRFERSLRRAGHCPRLVAVGEQPPEDVPDALVLVGGDGTVKHALPGAIGGGTPIYHVPLGNENLFAREFAMNRDPARLLRALDAWHVQSIDVAAATTLAPAAPARERFAIMLSVGPDASVIQRMDRDGRYFGGHMAYLAPIADELNAPGIVPITAEVDGRRIVDQVPGLLVVANMRQYAFRINPAAAADHRDGLLDLVFIPATSVGPLFWAAAWGRLGRLDRLPGVVRARGRTIRIDAPGGAAQVDGEPLRMSMPIEVSSEPLALRVLVPSCVG